MIKFVFISNLLFFLFCTEKNKNVAYFEPSVKTKQLIIDFKKYYKIYFELDKPYIPNIQDYDYWIEFKNTKKRLVGLKISHLKKSAVIDFSRISGYSKIDSYNIFIVGQVSDSFFKKTNEKESFKKLIGKKYKIESENYDPPYIILNFGKNEKLVSTYPKSFFAQYSVELNAR